MSRVIQEVFVGRERDLLAIFENPQCRLAFCLLNMWFMLPSLEGEVVPVVGGRRCHLVFLETLNKLRRNVSEESESEMTRF
jgi:hypothetical protein